jgi:hypothetical protein
LEKSRLRRFFQTAVSLPPAKGVTFAGYLAAAHRASQIFNTPWSPAILRCRARGTVAFVQEE